MVVQSFTIPSYEFQKVVVEGQQKYCLQTEAGERIFQTKKAYRRALSFESGGAWIEEDAGKKRYLIDVSGWFQTSYKQVSKKEFYEKLDTLPVWQRVLGLGLGILALAPGVSEFVKQVPKEAGMGLLALHRNNLALAALGCSFILGGVDAQAIGAEFQVNTYTPNAQQDPSVAGLADGGFVAVWASFEQDGDDSGIFGQGYDNSGVRVGSEFQINPSEIGREWYPSVTGLSNGEFVVVWESGRIDGSNTGIAGQRYAANYTKIGPEFLVNTYTSDYQERPKVTAFANGGFVVTWQSEDQDGNQEGIFAQRFDENGVKIDGEFLVNDMTSGSQTIPNVASHQNGGFMICWHGDQDRDGIYGAIFNSVGSQVGQEFRIDNSTAYSQSEPVVISLDTEYIVAWSGRNPSGILARRYDQNGNPIGLIENLSSSSSDMSLTPLNSGDFVLAARGVDFFIQRFGSNMTSTGQPVQANTYRTSGFEPDMAQLNNGGFVVVWGRGQDGDSGGIFGRMFEASGVPVATPTLATSNWQVDSEITQLSNGEFVACWIANNQDGSDEGIFGQRFDSSANPIGQEFQINSASCGTQTDLSLAGLSSGEFVVAWSSLTDDVNTTGTFGQMFMSNGSKVGDQFEFQHGNITINSLQVAPINRDRFIAYGYHVAFSGNLGYSLVYQKYNSSGMQLGPITIFNPNISGTMSFPEATSYNGDEIAIVWTQSDSGERIYGQRFDSFDSPIGATFQADTDTSSSTKREPDIARLEDGGFIVAWNAWHHTIDSRGGVFAQRFSSTGNQVGSEFHVNTETALSQEDASIAGLADGGFVIVWQSLQQDGSDYGIYGQRFGMSGPKTGPEFLVNTYTLNAQKNPRVIALDDGGFFVTWQSFGQDGNFISVYGQRFDSMGQLVGSEFRIPTASNFAQNCVDDLATQSHSTTSQMVDTSESPSSTTNPGLQISQTNPSTFRTTARSRETSQTNSSTSSINLRTESVPESSDGLWSSNVDVTSVQTGPRVFSIGEIVYEESYPIELNGVQIGSFSISGGNGPYSSEESNVLTIQLNGGYLLEDGEVLTLFTFAQEQISFTDILVEGESECSEITAESESPTTDSQEFRVIFSGGDVCMTSTTTLSALPLIATGGFV